MEDKKCKDLVEHSLNSRLEDLRLLWAGYCNGEEDVEDLGNLFEYGLCFDYCYPEKQEAGYFRYQISWGGPSEEFRIFANKSKHGWKVYNIDFWYLDWFDGAKISLSGEDFDFMKDLSEQFFLECSGDAEYEKAMENWDEETENE